MKCCVSLTLSSWQVSLFSKTVGWRIYWFCKEKLYIKQLLSVRVWYWKRKSITRCMNGKCFCKKNKDAIFFYAITGKLESGVVVLGFFERFCCCSFVMLFFFFLQKVIVIHFCFAGKVSFQFLTLGFLSLSIKLLNKTHFLYFTKQQRVQRVVVSTIFNC